MRGPQRPARDYRGASQSRACIRSIAGASIKIEVDDRAVIAAFNDLLRIGERPEPVLKAVGEYMLLSIGCRFASQTGPEHQPWRFIPARAGNVCRS